MREKKFTKGPWSIHKGIYDTGFDELVDDCGSHGEFFITTQSPAFQMSAASLDRNDDESIELEANARLIAAAPELLEALEGLILIFNGPKCEGDLYKYVQRIHPAYSKVFSAIDKVYGESEER